MDESGVVTELETAVDRTLLSVFNQLIQFAS